MRFAGIVAILLLGTAATLQAQELTPQAKRARRRSPVVEVFEKSRDSVVNISSTSIITVRESPFGFDRFFDEIFDYPFSRPRKYRSTSVGSGFVIHRDGYIVTNAHVVARTTQRKVTLADQRSFEARMVAVDSQHDLAILKIDVPEPLPALSLGRSDDLMTGETVIAVGNPLGYQHTVTAGVISALNREIRFSEDVVYSDIIQTDAAINPGNSGGPLLNVNGELIGVTTAIRGDAQNVGFAIPVDALRRLLPSLLNFERLNEVDFGAPIRATGAIGDDQGRPAHVGVRVDEIRPGSPADTAGLRPGDVIVSIEGQPVHTLADWYVGMLAHRSGDPVRLGVARAGGKLAEVAVQLADRSMPDGVKLARQRLGLQLKDVPDKVLRRMRLGAGIGLWVADVEAGSPADRVGIQSGDILRQLGKHTVDSVETLGRILEEVEPGDALLIGVLRVDHRWPYIAHGRIVAR